MATLKQVTTKLSFIKKNSRSLLTHVQVNDSRLYCTDLETSIRVNNAFGLEDGLHQFETIGLLPPIQHDDFPLIQFDTEFQIEVLTDVATIEHLLKFASNDETRLHLNGIAFNNKHLVATNGHIMRSVKFVTDHDENYIMSSTSLKVLMKMLKLYKIKSFTLKLNPDKFQVETVHFTLEGRLIQRDFPKWGAIVPAKYMYKFTVNQWINLKEVKILFNEQTMSCKIEGKDGIVKLYSNLHKDQSWTIGESDHDFELGFNMKYLDIASNKSKSFEIKYNNAYKPCLVNGSIVMPLKL